MGLCYLSWVSIFYLWVNINVVYTEEIAVYITVFFGFKLVCDHSFIDIITVHGKNSDCWINDM